MPRLAIVALVDIHAAPAACPPPTHVRAPARATRLLSRLQVDGHGADGDDKLENDESTQLCAGERPLHHAEGHYGRFRRKQAV